MGGGGYEGFGGQKTPGTCGPGGRYTKDIKGCSNYYLCPNNSVSWTGATGCPTTTNAQGKLCYVGNCTGLVKAQPSITNDSLPNQIKNVFSKLSVQGSGVSGGPA